MSNGTFTYAEIMAQPASWQEALTVFAAQKDQVMAAWRDLNPAQVIFTGCGSTHYLSMTAAALMQAQTGVVCRAVPASEFSFFPSSVLANPESTLLVAISRSGTTTETVAAMHKFRALGGAGIWGITCYPDTPVAQEVDVALLIPSAQEDSIAQTRSFASMLVMVQAMAGHLGGQDTSILNVLPKVGQALLDQVEGAMAALAGNLDLARLFFLGSGPQFGMANEAMLKMKEMSLTGSEAYHFYEFRHGPKAMVDGTTLVAGLLSKVAYAQEQAVLQEMAGLGATILSLGPRAKDDSADATITLPAGLPDWAMPVLYLPALQLLAYHRSMAKGLDPDEPRNLDAVVFLPSVL
jgi:glucosamine--fructose-6-phosphate aminotransferase (isomerizing)